MEHSNMMMKTMMMMTTMMVAQHVVLQVDELINSNLDLELVDTVADKDLDVLTSLIHDDVSLSLFTISCKALQLVLLCLPMLHRTRFVGAAENVFDFSGNLVLGNTAVALL